MTLSTYQASVPVLMHGLNNLRAILGKAKAHAEAKKIEPAALLSCRLYPDMYPLSRQVQMTADAAKFCTARLAGVEPPRYEDVETTFDELFERIDKTLAYLKEFDASQIDGAEDRQITLKLPSGPLEFSGSAYLFHFALPNFYFHATTAYGILRHCGVEIGKLDFLGSMQP